MTPASLLRTIAVSALVLAPLPLEVSGRLSDKGSGPESAPALRVPGPIQPAAQGAAKSSRYRFVNLNRVLEGWSKAKKMQEDYAADFERRNDALRARLATLEKMTQEVKSYQPGGRSEEFKRKAREVALAAAELKYDQEQVTKDRADQKLRILLSSYQQIQDVVAKWSSEHDVDAVFVIQEEDGAESDLVGRYERALVRQVLWYSKDLDISDEVVRLLEAATGAASRPANAAPVK